MLTVEFRISMGKMDYSIKGTGTYGGNKVDFFFTSNIKIYSRLRLEYGKMKLNTYYKIKKFLKIHYPGMGKFFPIYKAHNPY